MCVAIDVTQEGLPFVKIDHGIPVELVKSWVLGQGILMYNMNSLCLPFDEIEYLGQRVFGKHTKVLNNEDGIG